MNRDPQNVTDILDRLEATAERDEEVSIGAMMDAFGARSYGPFLVVPALIELSPIGAIPGVPTFLALIILLFAAQMVYGSAHFWVPEFIERRAVPAKRLHQASDRLRPVARRMDRWFHGRLTWLTRGPFVRLAAVACIVLAFTVPPLELFPFAASAPMLAIAMIGLALLVRDGALMIFALLIAAGAAAMAGYMFATGG